MFYEKLEEIGLAANEAKVYVELLMLGSSKASDVVKSLGVHRNIVYDNLDKLIDKGLVSYILEDSVKIFSAKSPEAFFDFFEEEEKKLNYKKKIVKDMMIDLDHLQKSIKIQEAQLFRGVQGLKQVLREVLKSKENFTLGVTNKSVEVLGETFWKNYDAKIRDLNIKEKMLVNHDFKDVFEFSELKNVKVKRLPRELNQVTETIIFDGKVLILIHSENPIALLVIDETFFNSYLEKFNFLWKISDKYFN